MELGNQEDKANDLTNTDPIVNDNSSQFNSDGEQIDATQWAERRQQLNLKKENLKKQKQMEEQASKMTVQQSENDKNDEVDFYEPGQQLSQQYNPFQQQMFQLFESKSAQQSPSQSLSKQTNSAQNSNQAGTDKKRARKPSVIEQAQENKQKRRQAKETGKRQLKAQLNDESDGTFAGLNSSSATSQSQLPKMKKSESSALLKETQVEDKQQLSETPQGQYVSISCLTRLKEIGFTPDTMSLVSEALKSGFNSFNAQARVDLQTKTAPVMAKEFFAMLVERIKNKPSPLYQIYGYPEKIAGLFYAIVHYNDRIQQQSYWSHFKNELIDACKTYSQLTDQIEDISDLSRIKEPLQRQDIEQCVYKLFTEIADQTVLPYRHKSSRLFDWPLAATAARAKQIIPFIRRILIVEKMPISMVKASKEYRHTRWQKLVYGVSIEWPSLSEEALDLIGRKPQLQVPVNLLTFASHTQAQQRNVAYVIYMIEDKSHGGSQEVYMAIIRKFFGFATNPNTSTQFELIALRLYDEACSQIYIKEREINRLKKQADQKGELNDEKIQEIESLVGPINTAFSWTDMDEFVSSLVLQSADQVKTSLKGKAVKTGQIHKRYKKEIIRYQFDMKSSLEQATQMVDGRSMKISDTVKMKEVETNIHKQFYKHDPDLAKCANYFRVMQQQLHEYKGYFMKLEYQVYVAASLYMQKGQFVSAQVAPGQGKTFCAVLLMHEHIVNNPYGKILYVTTCDDLRQQVETEVNDFLPNPQMVKVVCITADGDQEIDEDFTLAIIDEADHLLQNLKLICINERRQALRLGGLLTPIENRARTYFFSATYNKMPTQLLDEVFNSKYLTFKTMFQLTNAQTSANNYEIISRPVKDQKSLKETVLKEFINELEKNAKSQDSERHPIMFFFDDLKDPNNQALMNEISQIAQQRGVVDLAIENYNDVVKNKQILQSVSEAVLFMNGELGRGISLKMNNDAIVFVISSKDSFGLSQVKQMIGRGSRSFGKCIGYVFLVNLFAERMKGQAFLEHLNSIDNLMHPEPAPKILACAVKAWKSDAVNDLTIKMAKTAIMEVLGDRKWVVSWSSINQETYRGRPDVLKMLNAVAKVKVADTKGINEAMSAFAIAMNGPEQQKTQDKKTQKQSVPVETSPRKTRSHPEQKAEPVVETKQYETQQKQTQVIVKQQQAASGVPTFSHIQPIQQAKTPQSQQPVVQKPQDFSLFGTSSFAANKMPGFYHQKPPIFPTQNALFSNEAIDQANSLFGGQTAQTLSLFDQSGAQTTDVQKKASTKEQNAPETKSNNKK